MIPRARIDEARGELAVKTEAQIEYETAQAWGARAVAAFEIALSARDVGALLLGESLYHEALEHAALVDDGGHTAAVLTADVAPARMAAKLRWSLR